MSFSTHHLQYSTELDNKSREKPIQVTTTTRVGGRKEETVYAASLHFHLKYSAAPRPSININHYLTHRLQLFIPKENEMKDMQTLFQSMFNVLGCCGISTTVSYIKMPVIIYLSNDQKEIS